MRANLGLAGLLLFSSYCWDAPAQTPSAASTEKTDRLLVYGENFAFGVKEPEGWRGDTGELANSYHVNIVFVPIGEAVDAKGITIRVRVNSKVDENTIEDLKYDMAQYKKDYPKAQFGDLSISHPEYKTFAELVYVPRQFFEYVAYVNPGPRPKFTFSVAMSKKVTEATPDELKAFQTVLQSLAWIPTADKKK